MQAPSEAVLRDIWRRIGRHTRVSDLCARKHFVHRRRKQLIQSVNRFLLECGDDMGVCVEGQCDLTVSQKLHHHARLYTLGEEKCCIPVAKIVQPQGSEFGRVQHLLKRMMNARPVQRASSSADEHESELGGR